MLLRPDDQIRIVGIARAPTVPIPDVARGPPAGRIQPPVHKDLHPPVAPAPGDGDVVPVSICHQEGSTQGESVSSSIHPEGDPPPGQGDPVIPIVARPEDITVEEDVAEDPEIPRCRQARRAGVLRPRGFHPPFDGEISAEVGGSPLHRDLHPIDVPVSVAIETKGEAAHPLSRMHDPQGEQPSQQQEASPSPDTQPARLPGSRSLADLARGRTVSASHHAGWEMERG